MQCHKGCIFLSYLHQLEKGKMENYWQIVRHTSSMIFPNLRRQRLLICTDLISHRAALVCSHNMQPCQPWKQNLISQSNFKKSVGFTHILHRHASLKAIKENTSIISSILKLLFRTGIDWRFTRPAPAGDWALIKLHHRQMIKGWQHFWVEGVCTDSPKAFEFICCLSFCSSNYTQPIWRFKHYTMWSKNEKNMQNITKVSNQINVSTRQTVAVRRQCKLSNHIELIHFLPKKIPETPHVSKSFHLQTIMTCLED